MQEFIDGIREESIKALFACLTLGFGWFAGQRIIAYWDTKKKRHELDIAAATKFHQLYGEFKEVSRLWRAYRYNAPNAPKVPFPPELRLELLRRASAAEGSIEAITVKLAAERVLSEPEIRSLGLFRHAYQKLREAIRDDQPLDWTYDKPEYHLHNELTSRIAHIIASDVRERQEDASGAVETLRQIAAIRPDDWREAIAARGAPPAVAAATGAPREYFRAGSGAVIVNGDGLVLALERADVPGAWQLPQGGLHASEASLGAAFREVTEETGIPQGALELVHAIPEPLAYELPVEARSAKTGRGQVQHWFLFRFLGPDDVIDVTRGGEFRAWCWMPFGRLVEGTADFRKPVYRRLAEDFEEYFQGRA